MSSEAKRVKVLTLVELALGLVLAVLGIVGGIGGGQTTAPFVLAGEGLLTLVFGVRGALIANVPARIGQLARLAAAVLVLQVACVAGIVALVGTDRVADDPLLACAGAVPAVVTLVALLLARGMAKKAERLR